MGLVITMIITYLIIMIITLFKRNKSMEKQSKENMGDSTEGLILVIIGSGILSQICTSSLYTADMRGIALISFTFIYLIFWMICTIMAAKKNIK
jgi:C4-dicarboxylate transporter